MHWATEPIHARLFVLFILVVCCVAFVHALRLTYCLFAFGKRTRILLSNILDEATVNADLLAKSALTNSVSYVASSKTPNRDARPGAGADVALQRLKAADQRFSYLWEKARTEVTSINKLVVLTLLLSLLVIVYGAFPTWNEEFNNSKVAGFAALFGATDKLLTRLAFGLCASVVLYVISGFFEGVMSRRRAYWNYLRSRFESDLLQEAALQKNTRQQDRDERNA